MLSPSDLKRCIQTEMSRLRREMGSRSLMAFCRIYLGHHFRVRSSPMHVELAALLERATLIERRARIVLAAPRGHGKSTLLSVALPLWCVAYRREGLIYILSDTLEQASDHVAAIKAELESNELLREDFPEVAEPAGGTPRPQKWRSREIVTRNNVKLVALGSKSRIRGRKYRDQRPSLIIVDDLENDEEADSPERREKLLALVNTAILNAGTPQTNVIVAGTILSYGSVLAELLKAPGWTHYRYRAVIRWAEHEDLWQRWQKIFTDLEQYEGASGKEAARAFYEANREKMLAGTQVLWPEREDYLQLMDIRLTQGEHRFDAEKQSEPVNPKDALFRPDEIRYWEDEFETEERLLAAVGPRGIVVGALDPSLGKEGKNRDYSAIITLLLDPRTRVMYVLDADLAKRSPHDTIEKVLAFHERRQYVHFAVEATQFQEYLADNLRRLSRGRGRSLPVRAIRQVRDKIGRIQSLQPKVHTGEIRFSKQHPLLLQQLKQYPKNQHDDGPDALEMAIRVAKPTPSRSLRTLRVRRTLDMPEPGTVSRLVGW